MALWKTYFFDEEQIIEVLMKIYQHKGVHQHAFRQHRFLVSLGKYFEENGELTPKQLTALKRKSLLVYTLGKVIAKWNNKERGIQ